MLGVGKLPDVYLILINHTNFITVHVCPTTSPCGVLLGVISYNVVNLSSVYKKSTQRIKSENDN